MVLRLGLFFGVRSRFVQSDSSLLILCLSADAAAQVREGLPPCRLPTQYLLNLLRCAWRGWQETEQVSISADGVAQPDGRGKAGAGG